MKRLYIGGLGHAISQKDLKDRFGKFGDVSDVEIITRKDETGIPVKTFGYININISDEALRKCMTVLNKSKWKGGTLQIEMAKENFLHRLAVERQQTTEKAQFTNIEQKEKLVESFKKAGVENFHMKAAVPGTEIPGHKDWVVSKFGRVLPVLHLKGQGKNKMFKYDPSKHSHNIKRLESTADVPALTPVSQLTWEIPGGDDDISKKRRGEFPPQKARPNKIRKESLCKVIGHSPPVAKYNGHGKQHHEASLKNEGNSLKVSHGAKTLLTQKMTGQNGPVHGKEKPALKRQTKSLYVFDSEADSDEEIHMLVAQENARTKDVGVEDEDNLEVVGDDFTVKPSVFWAGQNSKGVLTVGSREEPADDREYDSADTDEILTQSKAPAVPVKQGEADHTQSSPSGTVLNKCDSKPGTSKRKEIPGSKVLSKQPSSVTKSRKEESEEFQCSASDSDSDSELDYEAMMAGCHRIELSLADLEQLAKEASMVEEEEKGHCQASDSQAGSGQETDVPFSSVGASMAPQAKKGNTPEEILAAILEEDSSDEENDKGRGKKKKRREKIQTPSLPAFLGTRALLETAPGAQLGLSQKRNKDEEGQETTIAEKKLKLEHTSQSSESSASECERKIDDGKLLPFKGLPPLSLPSDQKVKQKDHNDPLIKSSESESTDSNSDSSCSDSEEGENPEEQPSAAAGEMDKSAPKPGICSTSFESSSSVSSSLSVVPVTAEQVGAKGKASLKDSASTPTEQLEENTPLLESKKPSQKRVSTKDIQQKQKLDNQKRLAALEQKQKEAELQKKLIQGALSALDAPTANKGKHIVFDSDGESEEEAEQSSVEPHKCTSSLFEESSSESSTEEPSELGPSTGDKQGLRVKDFEKQVGSKLFDSSEDDEEADEEEGDDEARFQIKPQFEGKAGKKLMQLQSRFGTDERFRMDSRFLESDDESNIPEETSFRADVEVQLEEEKKKNLGILQSLLNIQVQSVETSKEAAKSKQFRDISALHYDPTREEHAAFEKKSEEPEKESKAARRKKREETEKLPEVSKEIYYDVAIDLKEAFGSQKESIEVKQAVAWDKEEEVVEEEKGEEKLEKQATEESTSVQLSLFSPNVSTENAESTGFQFSFFGNDSAKDTTEKDDYKIEILKGAKLPWQENPCFRDSSSEEEEDEIEEGTGDQFASPNAAEEPEAAKKSFFFFFQDDERLKEGPKMFCRSAKLEDQRENWEEKRTTLIEEYRKKHKDARRRLKASQKS
ncbi:nucleolar protein 8 [Anguilla anguilla]|uniref:nucleolar protein 8 n=1 Tax=Anguilla anguilla TaxID=7936 RepID=UPI0015AED9AA|nr:nucleolar protein 8 [Anguilla anguilla]